MTQPNHGSAADGSAKSDAIPVLSYESRHHDPPAAWTRASVPLIMLGVVCALLAGFIAFLTIVYAFAGLMGGIGKSEDDAILVIFLGFFALLGVISVGCFREASRRRGGLPPKVWVVLLCESLAGVSAMAAMFALAIDLR